MSEETTKTTEPAAKTAPKAAAPAAKATSASASKNDGGEKKSRRGGRSGRPRREAPEREFDQTIVDLARVTRVMAGGKRMRFRACVVIGDRKGRVGMGLGKAADVSSAINKAVGAAKKDLVQIPLYEGTLPHVIELKHGAAKVLLKPAPDGTGIIAGGAVRNVLDLGGVPNVAAKMMGSKNKVNNARATILALRSLQPRKSKSAAK